MGTYKTIATAHKPAATRQEYFHTSASRGKRGGGTFRLVELGDASLQCDACGAFVKIAEFRELKLERPPPFTQKEKDHAIETQSQTLKFCWPIMKHPFRFPAKAFHP